MPLTKRLSAEFLGTLWLVLGGCGAAVLPASVTTASNGIGFVGVSLAFGLTVLTGAYALGHISGGHFNPAVTLGLWAGKRFDAKDALPYIIAQVLGAVAGAGILYMIASGKAGFNLSGGFASNGFGDHSPLKYEVLAAFVSEVVMTFFFLIVILGATHKLLDHLERSPEAFSPNVLLRPLYQECVLPNIAYVGGGGEVAYWLQLRWLFQAFQVPMPVVCLRTSAAFLTAEADARLKALGLDHADLFQPPHAVEKKLALALTSFPTALVAERAALESLYQRIADDAVQVGPTFQRSVMSARTRAMQGLDHLEQRLVRSAKQAQAVAIGRYHKVREGVFPGGVLQEEEDLELAGPPKDQ